MSAGSSAGYTQIWGAACVVVLIIAGCAVHGADVQSQEAQLQTVREASASGPIALSAAEGVDGVIHLLERGPDGVLAYQRGTPTRSAFSDGNTSSPSDSDPTSFTWSSPHLIARRDVEATAQAFFAHGDTLLAVWLHDGIAGRRSTDGGETWSPVSASLPQDGRGEMAAASDGNRVVVAYRSSAGWSIVRGDAMGERWSLLATIDGPNRRVRQSRPVLALRDHRLVLVWNDRLTTGSPGVQYRLRMTESRNDGATWDRPVTVPTGRRSFGPEFETTYSFTRLAVALSSDKTWLAYQERGLFVQHLERDPQGRESWSSPERLSRFPDGGLSLIATDTATWLAWSDRRHQAKSWWGHVPLHQAVTWGADPYWANTDLYVSPLPPSDAAESPFPRRITPHLSYVQNSEEAIDLVSHLDRLHIFWSGRSRVGKTLDEYGAPTEIFHITIPPNDQETAP